MNTGTAFELVAVLTNLVSFGAWVELRLDQAQLSRTILYYPNEVMNRYRMI
mgnify:CR=1 FL=1